MAAAGMPKPQRQSSSHPNRLGRFQQAAQICSRDCVPRTAPTYDDADEVAASEKSFLTLILIEPT